MKRINFVLLLLGITACSVSVTLFAQQLPDYQLSGPLTVDGDPSVRQLQNVAKNQDRQWPLSAMQKVRISAGGFSRNLNRGVSKSFPSAKTGSNSVSVPSFQGVSESVAIEWSRFDEELKQTHYVTTQWLQRAAGDTGRVAVFTEKLGGQASIRPLLDPTLLKTGSDVAVRLYVKGGPVQQASLMAVHVDSGNIFTSESDDHGIAIVNLPESGQWRFYFHHSIDSADAIHSAVLNFEVGGIAR